MIGGSWRGRRAMRSKSREQKRERGAERVDGGGDEGCGRHVI